MVKQGPFLSFKKDLSNDFKRNEIVEVETEKNEEIRELIKLMLFNNPEERIKFITIREKLKDFKIIKRTGVVRVICAKNPKQKQRQG